MAEKDGMTPKQEKLSATAAEMESQAAERQPRARRAERPAAAKKEDVPAAPSKPFRAADELTHTPAGAEGREDKPAPAPKEPEQKLVWTRSMPAVRASHLEKEPEEKKAVGAADKPKKTAAPQPKQAGSAPARATKEPEPKPKAAPKKASQKAKPKPKQDAADGIWQPYLRPLVVLVVICLVTSLLLSLTYSYTKPIIDANAQAAEDEVRQELLPQATGFENITPDVLPDNITGAYRATNDVGYIVTSYGRGYGGQVPAMVAFNAEGLIAGVRFLENSETPGLGQKVSTDPLFALQFAGRLPEEVSRIDGITAATLSSNAAQAAVNAAINYYNVDIMGGSLAYDLPDEVLQQLVPGVGDWQTLDVQADGIAGAYFGTDGTYVLVAQAQGEGTVTAAVAMDQMGIIVGLWLDTSNETPGIGAEFSEDLQYMNQYIGRENTNSVQNVAGATHTSEGIKAAVDLALAALPAAKEAT